MLFSGILMLWEADVQFNSVIFLARVCTHAHTHTHTHTQKIVAIPFLLDIFNFQNKKLYKRITASPESHLQNFLCRQIIHHVKECKLFKIPSSLKNDLFMYWVLHVQGYSNGSSA